MKSDKAVAESHGAKEALIADLVARHYEAQAREVCKDRDGHWQVVERWSYGEYVGWFIEHDGYLYELDGGEYGEEGPFPSRQAALARMAEHLRTATSDLRDRSGR